MTQSTKSEQCTTLYGKKAWNSPTNLAQVGDLITHSPYARPTTQVTERRDYPNGNVLILTHRHNDWTIYAAYLFDSKDNLIAMPNFHYGDRVSVDGEYLPFDMPLPHNATAILVPEDTIEVDGERIYTEPMYVVLINNEETPETATVAKNGGFLYRGQLYRSLNQIVNLAVQYWLSNQSTSEYF